MNAVMRQAEVQHEQQQQQRDAAKKLDIAQGQPLRHGAAHTDAAGKSGSASTTAVAMLQTVRNTVMPAAFDQLRRIFVERPQLRRRRDDVNIDSVRRRAQHRSSSGCRRR